MMRRTRSLGRALVGSASETARHALAGHRNRVTMPVSVAVGTTTHLATAPASNEADPRQCVLRRPEGYSPKRSLSNRPISRKH